MILVTIHLSASSWNSRLDFDAALPIFSLDSGASSHATILEALARFNFDAIFETLARLDFHAVVLTMA